MWYNHSFWTLLSRKVSEQQWFTSDYCFNNQYTQRCMKLYQKDSIKSEVAPLTLEKGNHFSIRAGLQGLVRLSSCWTHSGTQGAKRTETREDIRTKERIQCFVLGLTPSPKCTWMLIVNNTRHSAIVHCITDSYRSVLSGVRGWGMQTQFEVFCSFYSHNPLSYFWNITLNTFKIVPFFNSQKFTSF